MRKKHFKLGAMREHVFEAVIREFHRAFDQVDIHIVLEG